MMPGPFSRADLRNDQGRRIRRVCLRPEPGAGPECADMEIRLCENRQRSGLRGAADPGGYPGRGAGDFLWLSSSTGIGRIGLVRGRVVVLFAG